MEHSLYEIVKAAQNNDEKSKLFLIAKFSNTIKHCSKKLCYDCAETDLIIFFLTLLTKLNLEKIKEFDEGSLINYFYISIKREYIKLSKKISYINSHEILLENDIIDFVDNRDAKPEIEDTLFLKSILNSLSSKQKIVFKFIINDYSDTEISNLIGISKQAIGRMKKRILVKIKNEYDNTI